MIAAETQPGSACHASCVVIGEDGVLIRGEAGSGKSGLCLSLIECAERDGLHAALVADDRVVLDAVNGRLVARPHPAIAGLVEIRGFGLHRMENRAEAAVVRLVVDLVEHLPRMPEPDSGTTIVAGLTFPGIRLDRSQPREYLIRQALRSVQARGVASRTHSAA